jgi:hypothetical protein
MADSKLTHPEQIFAAALVNGGQNGRPMTAIQAFQKAYPREKEPKTIRARAAVMAGDPRIIREVERLKIAMARGSGALDRKGAVLELSSIAVDAMSPPATRVQAIKTLAELEGWEAPKATIATENRRVLVIHTTAAGTGQKITMIEDKKTSNAAPTPPGKPSK